MQKVVALLPQVQLKIVGSNGVASRDFIVSLSAEKRVADLATFYNGNYLASLQKQIDSSLADKITFTGFVPQHELVSYYRDADVLVNPSFSESFGMSLIEAMACQVPTVATRVGGMTEIVDEEKTGILVEAGDAPALAQAIQRLVENDDLRKTMGKSAAQVAVARYSWERIGESLLHKYEMIRKND
jgi:glycosyltransferase involved in cell wall biosynthesis